MASGHSLQQACAGFVFTLDIDLGIWHGSSFYKGSGTVNKAFTLIELLIVVAIIAILAAIAVPNFLEAQVRAKVARAKSDMRSLATAVEAYCVDDNKYPIRHDNWDTNSGMAEYPPLREKI